MGENWLGNRNVFICGVQRTIGRLHPLDTGSLLSVVFLPYDFLSYRRIWMGGHVFVLFCSVLFFFFKGGAKMWLCSAGRRRRHKATKKGKFFFLGFLLKRTQRIE